MLNTPALLDLTDKDLSNERDRVFLEMLLLTGSLRLVPKYKWVML